MSGDGLPPSVGCIPKLVGPVPQEPVGQFQQAASRFSGRSVQPFESSGTPLASGKITAWAIRRSKRRVQNGQ